MMPKRDYTPSKQFNCKLSLGVWDVLEGLVGAPYMTQREAIECAIRHLARCQLRSGFDLLEDKKGSDKQMGVAHRSNEPAHELKVEYDER